MKRTILLMMVALAGCVHGQGMKYDGASTVLDAKYGFRDLTFGSAVPAGGEFIEAAKSKDGREALYERKMEDLRLGGAALSSISYNFYRGRFESVSLRAKGFTNSLALLRALQETYGPGVQSNPYIRRWRWSGSRVVMAYEHDEIRDEGTAYIWDRAAMEQRDQDEGAAARDANL